MRPLDLRESQPDALQLPSLLRFDEVLAVSREAGYDLTREKALEVENVTRERVLIEANKPGTDLGRCVLIGAFSYLLQIIRSGVEGVSVAAIAVAVRFLEINPVGTKILADCSAVPLNGESLTRFAEIISLNDYDWLDFSISFLDPEEARRDRIRRNLLLSPTERWNRHRNLMRQLVAARNVNSGNRS